MDTKIKTTEGKSVKHDGITEHKPKSKTRLFWEKYPNGIESEIINMRAVLK